MELTGKDELFLYGISTYVLGTRYLIRIFWYRDLATASCLTI